MFPFLPLVVGLSLSISSFGAKLASPSWRSPRISTSVEDRVDIAGAAVDMAVSKLDSDHQFDVQGLAWGVAGYFYSQMADFDIASNQTKYKDTLSQYFLRASTLRANFSDELYAFSWDSTTRPDYCSVSLDYGLSYGHAAIRAYAAYKDQIFLDHAVQSWWFGRSYTLSDAGISSGKSDAKEFPIEKQCQGISMTGGTFGNTLTTDTELTGLSTG
ncbi:hypothetical protein B0H19DRAFT_1260480 [Mycena capillaripes]|nr:hypothetical protein B0H19DRAFT_1260480 [Mycena capillaripes]